jgi:hypothetical protein
MLGNEGQAATATALLAPGNKADTAACTGSWIDVNDYEGDLVFVVQVGTVTAGQVALAIETASDGSGTGAATLTLTEGAFTTVTTSNDPLTQKRTAPAGSALGWVRVKGTVTTGPVDMSAAVLGRKKYV